jgi:hypothetical protein
MTSPYSSRITAICNGDGTPSPSVLPSISSAKSVMTIASKRAAGHTSKRKTTSFARGVGVVARGSGWDRELLAGGERVGLACELDGELALEHLETLGAARVAMHDGDGAAGAHARLALHVAARRCRRRP